MINTTSKQLLISRNNKMKFFGLYTDLITPFDHKGKLDEDGVITNIQTQLNSGVDGVVLFSDIGEHFSINESEKKKIVASIKNELPVQKTCVHCYGNTPKEMLKNMDLASQNGADAVIISLPKYALESEASSLMFLKEVCSSPFNSILLQNKKIGNVDSISIDNLKSILEYPNVLGIKESSSDIPRISDIMQGIKKYRPDFSILCENDAFIFSNLSLGVDCIVSVASNLIPQAIKNLIFACKNNCWLEARARHYLLWSIFSELLTNNTASGIKCAMNFFGIPSGSVRAPLLNLSKNNKTSLERVLRSMTFSLQELQEFAISQTS